MRVLGRMLHKEFEEGNVGDFTLYFDQEKYNAIIECKACTRSLKLQLHHLVDLTNDLGIRAPGYGHIVASKNSKKGSTDNIVVHNLSSLSSGYAGIISIINISRSCL